MRPLFLVVLLSLFSFANNNGWESIHHAVFNGKRQQVQTILDKSNEETEAVTTVGLTPLHIAVKRRNLDMVKLLVNYDADIDAQDNKGFSVLYYAVLFNQLDIAKYLLNHEADPNLTNNIGNAPIHNIAFRNRFELLELFMNYETNFRLKNRFGMLPHHFAQENGHSGMAMELKSLLK